MSLWFMQTPMTWIMHGVVALTVALVGGVAAILIYPTSTGFAVGYCVAALAAAIYFNYREARDKEKHKAEGRYDESQPGAGTTNREDRIGDLIAPYSIAGSGIALALGMYVASLI